MSVYTLPNTISNGDTFNATPVQGNFDSIENELNSIDGSNIDIATIPDDRLINGPRSVRNETMSDFISSGLTSVDPGTTLTATIVGGVAYIQGYRVAVNAYINTYTASKDCYVDLDKNGQFHVTEVSNNAVSPSLYANSTRICKFVTNGTEITSYTDLRNVILKQLDTPKLVNRQDNTTNNVVSNQLIQTGWGYIQGDSNNAIAKSITLPIAFDSTPIVFVSSLQKRTSVPVNIDDFNVFDIVTSNARSISSTSFTVAIHKTDGTLTGQGNYFGYSWIAIGTKAR